MRVINASVRTNATLIVCAFVLVACAVEPTSPDGSIAVRGKLSALQNDAELASFARVQISKAEEAVEMAEKPLDQADKALGAHRVYMADQQVEIAKATAATKLAESQRARLNEARSDARLDARTREADRAYADAVQARRSEAQARSAEAEARSSEAAALSAQADMQRRLKDLKAKETERGIVVTLGDVLFDTGSAQIRSSSGDNLYKLGSFLTQYPDRRALIEGHTDNVGGAAFNKELSQRRAESVKRGLEKQGIASSRMSVSGKGLERPVATNNTAAGRQQNRRVEIIIENTESTLSTGVGGTSSSE